MKFTTPSPEYIKKIHDVVIPLGFEVAGKNPLIFCHPNYFKLIDLTASGYGAIDIMINIMGSVHTFGMKCGEDRVKMKVSDFISEMKV